MKKAVIATYCERDSYGSILQSLALKNVLSNIGFKSEIVKKFDSVSQEKISLFIPRSPGQCVLIATRIFKSLKIKKRFKRTLSFIKEYIDFKNYETIENLSDNLDADVYIAGSDQIWHPKLCNSVFFLEFAKSKKCISYAASMGVTDIPEENKEKFAAMLQKFKTISVREADNAEIIKDKVSAPVDVHIDPTFLCEKSFWQAKENPYKIKEPFILVYPIYWNISLNKELEELHKKTGIKIISVCNDWMRVYANEALYDVGPAEFLWLINHAEAVVTSSFHGVALSTIYNKKIAIVNNPKNPSRVGNLIDVLGLKVVPISEVLNFDTSIYKDINKKIDYEKQRSLAYLKENLNDE